MNCSKSTNYNEYHRQIPVLQLFSFRARYKQCCLDLFSFIFTLRLAEAEKYCKWSFLGLVSGRDYVISLYLKISENLMGRIF